MYIITSDVCLKLGVLAEGETYTAEDTKTKIIFVVGQWIYMFLMLLPVPLYFHIRSVAKTFLIDESFTFLIQVLQYQLSFHPHPCRNMERRILLHLQILQKLQSKV